MTSNEELWDEFERHMKVKDEKASVSVGKRDKGGNLFILGGHMANLWRLKNGLYEVNGEKVASEEDAVELYNSYNGTTLRLDYVSAVFNPWYEKQFKVVAEVPSATSNAVYTIRRNPDGKLLCECKGFMFRGTCWHVEAIENAEDE